MREIKFRCWSEKDKAMYPCSSPWMGNVMALVEGGDSFVFEGFCENNVKVMQFTGLKDKNGKEIYEGDIVAFDNTKMTTEWWGKKARFIFYQKGWQETHDVNSEALVIGNIWENPELLKSI